MKRPFRFTRDSVLFAAGLLGVAYETFVAKVDRPSLLVLFAAMLGLPAFLKKDEGDKDDSAPRDPKDR